MTVMVETRINDLWTLLLPEHRAARPEWATGWEVERLAAMRKLIHRGDVVFDVGAEEGDLPALWASWGADVVLIEPNPRVWPNIRAIFEANRLDGRVAGWWLGFAGEATRPGAPEWPSPWSGLEGWPECAFGPVIGDHGFLVLDERPDCPVTTLDYLAQTVAPTVLTIDVEGAELAVLRGAETLLRTMRPAVFVSIHVHLPWIDEHYPDDTRAHVLAYMEGLGYAGRFLALDHEEHWEFRHPVGR